MIFFAKPVVSKAALSSSVEVGGGFTSLSLSSPSYTGTLSGIGFLEFNYVLKHNSLSSAFVMHFSELLKSEEVLLPLTRFAAGYRFYPMGFNGTRVILDNGVTGRVWKSTPYVGLDFGLVNISIASFNASVVEVSPRFGVELPLADKLMLHASLVLNAGSSAPSESNRSLTYTGITGTLSLIISNL